MEGYQAGLAQRRLLERERQGTGAVIQVTDAHADQPARGHGLVADHRYRAGRVISHVTGDRPQHRHRERADPAKTDHQHQRARPAASDRPRGLALDRGGVDPQARGQLGGPGRRRGQGPVTVLADVPEGSVVFWLEREQDHLGQRCGRDDPQRGTAEHGLPHGKLDRPQ